MASQQYNSTATTHAATTMRNDDGTVTRVHPFGAIGQEVKAASHTSTASTYSSDDQRGGVLVTTPYDGRERAGSLRELVQQSTPDTSTDLAMRPNIFHSTSSRHEQVSPCKSTEALAEVFLRSPAWLVHSSPESATYAFEPLPPRAINSFAPEPFHAQVPPDIAQVPPQIDSQRFHAMGSAPTFVPADHYHVPRPMQIPSQVSDVPPNLSPERNVMGYRELVNGITKDLEMICREHVLITISTNTADSDTDLAFLDLVVAHMESRDAAVYILKRPDLHIALVVGLIWRQVSTYILSRPVLDKAPSRSAAAFYHAYLDETFAHAYDSDNLALRQSLVERRSSFVSDIQRAPEYQAFVKTFATQVANDIVKDLTPAWKIGFTYKVSQVLIDKVTTRLVRLISRMRAEAKVFHFDFYTFGTQFSSATMSKRNPDLLFEHGNDGTYAVMCDIAPAVFEMDLSAGQLNTSPIYLAEVLVFDQSKEIDDALEMVKLYGPMPMPPPFGGRRRSRRKTGTAPFLNRRDSTTMHGPN